jgi:nicotinamidase-related amidase
MSPVRLGELVTPECCAVVVQEMQNGVVGDESALPHLAEAVREVGVIEQLPRLLDAARRAGVPVVHTTAESLPGRFGANRNARLFAGARAAGAANASGTRSVEPIAELGGWHDDIVLPRYHGLSPMTGGPLDSVLRNQGITTLVLTGVSLNIAITNLTMDAVNRGYQVVIPSDTVAGYPVEFGRAILDNVLHLLATITTTDDVVTAWHQ